MKNFLKKYDIWVSFAVFLAVVLLAAFLVAMPLMKNIAEVSDNIQKRMIDDEMNRSRVSKIPEMEKAGAIFDENRNDLDVMMKKEKEIDFIKRIEALAEETGNKIELKIADAEKDSAAKAPKAAEKKDPEDIKGNLPYQKYLSIGISLEGDYGQALNFIHKLENMNYYVNIISLDMSKAEVEEDGSVSRKSVFSSSRRPSVRDAAAEQVKEILKSDIGAVIYLNN